MNREGKPVRVLYSFPLKLGAGRICTTAWYQVDGLASAGAEVTVFPASIIRPLPANVKVKPTLARGKLRVPHKLLGRMAYASLHDGIVARRIEKMAGQIDIIHAWPLGSVETLRTAARLGIPTVLERCNAHTRFAYEVVRQECDRLGVPLPADHEHAYNAELLAREEEEYRLAFRLLCPSDFVVKTFLDQGFSREKLVRHIYGFDETVFHPDAKPREPKRGLTMLSVGVCAVRKGLHYALEAWLQSPASREDDLDLDFPGLLRLVSAKLRERGGGGAVGKGGVRWIRFLTSHPKDLSDEVIAVLAEDPLYCRHVHLCVQSGSDSVLKAMNRRYTRDSYLGLVERMKAAIPGLSLSSDILVGFPGESEADLELTLDLMRRVGFSYSYMYHFNPRDGTPAAIMPGRIRDNEKRERLARVIELQKDMTKSIMESRVGAVEEVLVESLSRRTKSEVLARTQRDEMVVFPAPPSRVGSFAKVRLLSLSGNTFKAEEAAL